jgi:hypothetical protein
MTERKTLSATSQHRLEVQGFTNVDSETLADVAPWYRMAFALCASLAGIGTVLASPVILWALAFQSGELILGYVLGAALISVGMLVGTTDICIPSMIYNALLLRSQ